MECILQTSWLCSDSMDKRLSTSSRTDGRQSWENSTTSAAELLLVSISLLLLTTSEALLWWTWPSLTNMVMRRSTLTGLIRWTWSHMMFTAGLTSIRTTCRTRCLSLNPTLSCLSYLASTRLLSLVAKTDWLVGSCLVPIRLTRSGVTLSCSSSIAAWMMTSRYDLSTSTGFNSGTKASSQRQLSWTPHPRLDAHSSSCLKMQDLSENLKNLFTRPT